MVALLNLTGEQIRSARVLLGLGVWRLAQKSSLAVSTIERIERGQALTAYQNVRLKRALETAGVEFTNGDQPGVRLGRKADP